MYTFSAFAECRDIRCDFASLDRKKLDFKTHALYEQSLKNPREIQNVKALLKFLEARFQTLEIINSRADSKKQPDLKPKKSFVSTTDNFKCNYCNSADHFVNTCDKFLQLSITERIEAAKEMKICLNCLRGDHRYMFCRAQKCKKCFKKHNTLLHIQMEGEEKEEIKNDKETTTEAAPSTRTSYIAASAHGLNSYVLLATATVKICVNGKRSFNCRAFLDSDSQLNFITQSCWKKLGISSQNADLVLGGIGETKQ